MLFNVMWSCAHYCNKWYNLQNPCVVRCSMCLEQFSVDIYQPVHQAQLDKCTVCLHWHHSVVGFPCILVPELEVAVQGKIKWLLEYRMTELFVFFALLLRCCIAFVVVGVKLMWDICCLKMCCSGNGLSGMGLLSILSFIMIAATFASGMTSAFLMQWYALL